MRVVSEITHPELKITIFHWNNRYLIKLEAGLFEQTYKIQEYDVDSEEDVKKLVNDEFIRSAIDRFNQMAESLHHAIHGG
jgi:predicted secreted protein